MNILIAPFVNALFGFYYLTHNLGWAIIIVTILIRIILLPLVMPSLKSAAKMRELQPKLNKLKEKFKGDKTTSDTLDQHIDISDDEPNTNMKTDKQLKNLSKKSIINKSN